MIFPLRWTIMWGTTARVTLNEPRTFVSSTTCPSAPAATPACSTRDATAAIEQELVARDHRCFRQTEQIHRAGDVLGLERRSAGSAARIVFEQLLTVGEVAQSLGIDHAG